MSLFEILGPIFSQPKIPQFPAETSLAGHTVLITGASSGIGYATALECLKLNVSTLIIAVRNMKKGESTKKTLLANSAVKGSPTIDVMSLDLISFKSVHAFVDSLKKKYDHLDQAILNAGMSIMAWEVTKDGHESNVQVNYLSNILLAFLLLPLLREKSPISSSSYLTIVGSTIDIRSTLTQDAISDDDLRHPIAYLSEKRSWDEVSRYPDTKLLVSMFIRQMAQHTKASGRDCIINIACPGFTAHTGFDAGSIWSARIFFGILRLLAGRPLDAAARTVLYCAILGKDETRGELLTSNIVRPPLAIAINPKGKLLEKSLWEDTVKFLEKEAPGCMEYL